MSLDLKVKELYSNLKTQSKKSEVHIVSLTNKNISHYFVNRKNPGNIYSKGDFDNIEDIMFINTTKELILGKAEDPGYSSLKKYMSIHKFREKKQDGEVNFVYGAGSKIPQLFVIHNTVLGPGIGGLRERDYNQGFGDYFVDAMLTDALRLAEAMTYKGAINDTLSGGGKAARNNKILNDEERKDEGILKPHEEKRKLAGEELAIALNAINKKREERKVNCYHTAEDMNTGCLDFDNMYNYCKENKLKNFAICKSEENAGTGNPSEYTAIGVVESMLEGARRVFGNHRRPLKNKVILVEGLGNCGSEVVKRLVIYGAKVIACDVDEEKVERSKLDLGDRSNKVKYVVYTKDQLKDDRFIFLKDYKGDIYSPCATGGRINEHTREILYDNGIRLIAGSANNQLAEEKHDSAVLHHMPGMLYLPDYIVNGSGLINARQELPDIIHTKENMIDLARNTKKVISKILDISSDKKISPSEAAQSIVDYKLIKAEKSVK